MTTLADTDPESALAPLQAAACTYRLALGPRAGQKVLSLQTVPSQAAQPTPQRWVNAQGFEGARRGRLRRPRAARNSNTCVDTLPAPPLPTTA
jgi:hypothetical protein